MCDVFSASIAVTAISTAVSAYGAYKQQEAANKAAEYNAQVQERAAEVSKYQAETAKKIGDIEAEKVNQQTRQMIAAQRAGFAGAGINVGEGSPLDVQTQTAQYGYLDAQAARRNAELEAWGYGMQGQSQLAQAQGLRSTKASALLPAGTSLLAGASSIADKYYTHEKLTAGTTRAPKATV